MNFTSQADSTRCLAAKTALHQRFEARLHEIQRLAERLDTGRRTIRGIVGQLRAEFAACPPAAPFLTAETHAEGGHQQ